MRMRASADREGPWGSRHRRRGRNRMEIRVEWKMFEHGIPLPEGTVRNLRRVAQRFEVPMP